MPISFIKLDTINKLLENYIYIYNLASVMPIMATENPQQKQFKSLLDDITETIHLACNDLKKEA